jgi:GH15 family glucan-1,4-alpha-glucosidase
VPQVLRSRRAARDDREPRSPEERSSDEDEDYALIGDLQTSALVGRNGSVDWLCLPRFDSASCFTALLGEEKHGRWLIAPVGEVRSVSRRYRQGTLILETDFQTAEGAARVIDFMPLRDGGAPQLMRIVQGLGGRVPMRMQLIIRFEYGSVVPWVQRVPDGIVAQAGPDAVHLSTPAELRGEDLTTVAEFTVGEGASERFALSWFPSYQRARSNRGYAVGADPHRGVVARLVGALHLPGRLPQRGPDLADRPQGPHRPGHRRGRRRAHHVAAGGPWRRAQLGYRYTWLRDSVLT